MKSLKTYFFLLLVFVLALGLRLPHLNSSIWYEEAAQLSYAQNITLGTSSVLSSLQPPFFPILSKTLILFTNNELILRTLLALLPALFSIYFIYQIARKLFSEGIAIVTSLLLATSSLHVFYSQEIGSFSLITMLSLASWWLLINTQAGKNIKAKIKSYKLVLNRKFVWVALISILGLYTSYLYLAVILAQALFVLLQKRTILNEYIFSISLTALAFLPQLPTLLAQLKYQQNTIITTPYFDSAANIAPAKALLLIFGKFTFGVLNLNLGLVMTLGAVLLLSILLFIYKDINKKSLGQYFSSLGFIKQENDHHGVEALTTITIALFVPLLLILATGFTLHLFEHKHLLFTLPFFYLLIASSIFFSKRKIFAYLVIGVILAVNFYSLAQYYFRAELQRENWRDLHTEIATLYPAQSSTIIFAAQDSFAPWDWYSQNNYPVLTTGTDIIRENTDLKSQLKNLTDYQFILVFDYGRHLSDPSDKVLEEVLSYGYEQVDILNYPGIGFIRVFARSNSLISYFQLE